ncbi:uncharacterized protein [Labrus bergylta]|uniref:uncharacterized protein isoform X2 n=1 Tax=Labrus bergylta TaxID=56723 RepID=UPI00331442A3
MKTAALVIRLLLICCGFIKGTPGDHLEGSAESVVQSECRDRYLWIHVTSTQTPRFEAVDENGVHSISEQLASLCGYTISSFKKDSATVFRASYFSCFTHNQNDQVFTFTLNVIVRDAAGRWISTPVSAVCSSGMWAHREITCEEDYMEVNVNRDSSCGGLQGEGGHVWQTALSQAQRTASSVWQLMVLMSDGQVSSMSISEAQRWGFSLTTTAQRIVLRSQYKQPHGELTTMDGVPVEVVRVSVFSKEKLTMVMVDVSMACTLNSGSFDGSQLLWEVPLVMAPLVGEGVGFESRSLGLGVEGLLLDNPNANAGGFSLVQQGSLVQIRAPFGAEGGYRKGLVLNNTYKETYVISLLYEHVFSLLFEDGSSINTKHRTFRVLDTPLICRPPFSLDQTLNDDKLFRVYLGNIPADATLQEVLINGEQLLSQSAEQGYMISSVVHANGSHAYQLQLLFEHPVVQVMYLGQGVVQYSADINFTLTIMPQGDSFYHHTFLTAQVTNTFPPEITAQCSDGGITFSVVRPLRAESLWEVGVDQEPLTSELAAQRGYRLYSESPHKTTLEVPLFSIGYTYEEINLSNFYGTFGLLLRDSKTLEVQTSTSKRCLFKTQDMIVCSSDGTMTVATTPTSTWPTVQPERTTLLDPTCRPKEMDRSRVLFEFNVNSCGTRVMAGDSYMVYENEVVHDRQMIADGPNFISRESQFKLTVRCFYPLSQVNRLSVDRIFTSDTPGFGSVKIFQSLKDSDNKLPAKDCLLQAPGNKANTPTDQVHQTPEAGSDPPHYGIRPKPGPSHFITVPGGQSKLLYSPQNLQNFPNLNLLLPHEGPTISTQEVPLQVSFPASSLMSQTEEQPVFRSPTEDQLSNFPPRYNNLPDHGVQQSNLDTHSFSSGQDPQNNPGLSEDNLALGSTSSSKVPGSLDVGQVEANWGRTEQSSGEVVWPSRPTWDQPNQQGLIQNNQDLQSPPGMQELTQYNVANLDSGLSGYSSGGQEMAKPEEVPGNQPQSKYDPSLGTQLHNIGSSKVLLPSRNRKYIQSNTKPRTSQNPIPARGRCVNTAASSLSTSQPNQNPERPGSLERRNTESSRSGVQKIRVKPLSKLVSSGHKLNQKPVNQQVPNTSMYATGLTAERSDGNHQTSQHPPELAGSDVRMERVQNPTLTKEQMYHGVQGQPDQSAVIDSNYWSQNKQDLVHQVTTQQGPQQTVIQPTGESHSRVRLFSGLQERFPNDQKPKQQNLQYPSIQSETGGGTSRPSFLGVSAQHISNSPENQPNNPTRSSERRPAAGAAGVTGSNMGLNGSSGSGSHQKIHTSSDCSRHSQYGSSVHNGIMRGKQIS